MIAHEGAFVIDIVNDRKHASGVFNVQKIMWGGRGVTLSLIEDV